jgi:hypothetical protein
LRIRRRIWPLRKVRRLRGRRTIIPLIARPSVVVRGHSRGPVCVLRCSVLPNIRRLLHRSIYVLRHRLTVPSILRNLGRTRWRSYPHARSCAFLLRLGLTNLRGCDRLSAVLPHQRLLPLNRRRGWGRSGLGHDLSSDYLLRRTCLRRTSSTHKRLPFRSYCRRLGHYRRAGHAPFVHANYIS